MVRPQKNRRVSETPSVRHFKPQGIPLAELEEVVVTEDGLEAVRLADREGLYHEEAAERMGVSRPTYGRILLEARRAIADALILGKAIRIEGGRVEHVVDIPNSCCGRKRCRRGWTRWTR